MTPVPFLEPTPDADPLDVFLAWFGAASAAGVLEPEAMTLATATSLGVPSARVVLYRGLSGRRLRFFTNTASRKGDELRQNPACALVFHWGSVQRQVRVEGRAERLGPEEDDAYFRSRPLGHQIGATVSRQSQPIESYAALERAVAERARELAGRAPERPPHWGGYGVTPQRWEFWTGRADRLHERASYERDGDGWRFSLLAP